MSTYLEGTRIKKLHGNSFLLSAAAEKDGFFVLLLREFGLLDNVGLWFCFGYMSGDFACIISRWLK